jgi:hypothetical protein
VAASTGLVTGQVPVVRAGGERPAGFPDRVGEGDQVVGGGRGRGELAVVPDQFPASGGGEAAGVRFAQVVRVGFGERGERADDGGGLVVNVGQCGDRLSGTAVPGAAPW